MIRNLLLPVPVAFVRKFPSLSLSFFPKASLRAAALPASQRLPWAPLPPTAFFRFAFLLPALAALAEREPAQRRRLANVEKEVRSLL